MVVYKTLHTTEMASERVYEGNGALKYLSNVTSMSSQNLKKNVPTINHQYYGSLEFNSNSSFTVNDNRFEWYYSDAGGTMVFARKTATNGEWKKLSSIQILSDETYINQEWELRNFTVNANEASYVDNLLIIDLTESFGSGNEPEAEWVDENIPWFENTASIYEGSILSEHRNEIGISLTNEYLVEQMECSNADIEVEGDKIVITNVKGEVSCRVKTKDTIAPSSSFTIGSSTTGSNGWYKALTVQANLSDNGSGVSSAKYCTTTGSTCTPNVDASISNNTFTVTLGSNASAQKVCTQVTDVSGNTSGVNCSNSYNVDTANPTVTISASVSNNTITVRATGSDAHSGIASYQYSRDNSTWYTSTSGTYNFTGLGDGNYTLYVKSVDKSGRVSNTANFSVTVRTTPILTMAASGGYEWSNTNNVYSVDYGTSSGTVSCINTSRNNSGVTTFLSIGVLGPNTIRCTATSSTGKSVTASATYNISWTVSMDVLGAHNGAIKNGNQITIPKGGTQYGPYVPANAGCYRVWYDGSNLNACPQVYEAYDHYTYGNTDFSLLSLNYLSSNSNYYIKVDKSYNKLETILYNSCSTTITVTNLRISYVGPESSCPSN